MVKNRLIVALDLYDVERALGLIHEIGDNIYGAKVNWPLIMSEGIGVIRKLSKETRVICDLKLADIPNTVRLITEKAREQGGFAIITHSFTGSDSLSAVVRSAGPMKVFSVVAMSHAGSSEFITPSMDSLIDISIDAGVSGFIAPGNNYEVLRHIRKRAGKLTILSPGIGAQGGDPSLAIRNGADFIIVGRSIYNSENPSSTVRQINNSLKGVF